MRHTIRLFAFALLSVALWHPPAAGQASPRPKLIVVVAVDQMRGDYPVRYGGLLEHGLKQLLTDGAWYKNAAYPYLNTVTCAGHSTIGTGTFPYKHGMVLNAWHDRESGKSVACTSDPSVTEVSYANFSGTGDSAKNVKMPSLAELIHKNKGRVVTMSIKARSAIGLAGHEADSVTWLDERGAWETSTAYAKTPAPWLAAFVKGNPLDRDAGKTWERTLPVDRYQFMDEAPGERGGAGWSATFPHPLGAAGDRAYLAHWLQSPFADAYLEEMAEAAIDDLKLGQESRTDFLGVSFSALDAVGHGYGPRSHEVQDLLVRLDTTIAKLIAHLDQKVGRNNYVLGLSADHGVADIPDQVGGGRQSSEQVIATIEEALKPLMPGGPFVTASAYTDIYLKPVAVERLKSDKRAMSAVSDALVKLPGITRVLRADELGSANARESKDPQVRAAALSYFAGRSGDIIIIPKENWLLAASATTHGTLYPYDQRVPVILFGAGIQAGPRDEPATPADLTATLAAIAGVQLPSPDGHVLRVTALASTASR
jgi:predicted AlkP superfamily pyrophosphatase or phosphodiesterase